MPDFDVKTPETSRLVKVVVGAMAAVAASASLYLAESVLSSHRASQVAIPASAATPAVAHHAEPEPVLTRLQIERIAEQAAERAAARVERTSEERRGHDRELLAERLGAIQHRLEAMAQTVEALAARRPGRRR